jgi:hypothetical protein
MIRSIGNKHDKISHEHFLPTLTKLADGFGLKATLHENRDSPQ